jgi:hypothetical protein
MVFGNGKERAGEMKSIILHDFEVRNALKNDVIQIRRPVKPPILSKHLYWEEVKNGIVVFDNGETGEMRKCPFGQPGDRLWVRETWVENAPDGSTKYFYRADKQPEEIIEQMKAFGYKWRPSIHMPRWASRITLEIDGIRVEPVQDITEDDAKAEGFEAGYDSFGDGKFDDVLEREWTARDEFCDVWNSIYAKKGFGWDNNLPVWVGKFKIAERK